MFTFNKDEIVDGKSNNAVIDQNEANDALSQMSNLEARMRVIRHQSTKIAASMQADKEFGFSSKYILGKKIGEGMHARCFICTKKNSS